MAIHNAFVEICISNGERTTRMFTNPYPRLREENGLTIFETDVDCDITLIEMMSAGEYDSRHYCYSETGPFKIAGHGFSRSEIVIVHPGHTVADLGPCEKRFAEAAAREGLRRPGIEHVLAFGAQYPIIQRMFPTIAVLEKPWADAYFRERMPILRGDCFMRQLGVVRVGTGCGYGPAHRFLFVR